MVSVSSGVDLYRYGGYSGRLCFKKMRIVLCECAFFLDNYLLEAVLFESF
jgi:hypothetical protein